MEKPEFFKIGELASVHEYQACSEANKGLYLHLRDAGSWRRKTS